MLTDPRLKNICLALQIFIIYYWMSLLLDTDSCYTVYLLSGIAGILCCCINWKQKRYPEKKQERLLTILFSFVLSLSVILANYMMFTNDAGSSWMQRFFSSIGMCLGGMVLFGHIFICLAGCLRNFSFPREEDQNLSPVALFAIISGSIIIPDLLILFLSEYPGCLTFDSFSQISQALSGQYSNHHPFYHTMVIKFFVEAGYTLWGNINAAVATYSVFQIVFMAVCFSFRLVTLYQAGIRIKYIVFGALFYICMPFHIIYSFTVWKDVMFGGFVLLFTASVFRVFANVGRHGLLNYLYLTGGGLGMCLFRSNGWFACLLTFIGFIVLFGKKYLKICFTFIFVLVISFVLQFPVLAALNVSQPDTIESLSIPAQQIARVVTDCDDLNESQRDLLNEIVAVDKIPITYQSYISDPIKNLVRERDNQDYLLEHKREFIGLYIDLGLKHPTKYVEAWIDQTKGFWHGGYRYWVWFQNVQENKLGISREVKSEKVHLLLSRYLESYNRSNMLVIFLCIGFYVWGGVGIVCYISLLRRDRIALFLTFPVIAVILTLLIATPVYAEFRYAYSIFCTIPFLIFMPFTEKRKKESTIDRA